MKIQIAMFGLMVCSQAALAQVPESDAMSDASAEIAFQGAPGVEAKAMLVSNAETQPSLVIFHKRPKETRYETVIENNKLGLTIGQLISAAPGNEASLSVNPAGSLQLMSGSQNGPKRWERTLTIAYRNGQYVVAGFKLSYEDSYAQDPEKKHGTCDYNLLTGKGARDGKDVAVSMAPLPLATLEEGARLETCSNWAP